MRLREFRLLFLIISLFSFFQIFSQTKNISNILPDSLDLRSEESGDLQNEIKLNWQSLYNHSLNFQKKYNMFTSFDFMDIDQFNYLSANGNNEIDYYNLREELLSDFRWKNNWEVKKKYSVFAEYLGYAQILGAMSLLGVHIHQWNNLDNSNNKPIPKKLFNRYGF